MRSIRNVSHDESPLETPRVPRQKRRFRALDAFYDYPAFRYLWASNFLFFAGVWTQTLVLGWLAFDLTGSTALLGIFTAVRLAPMLLGPLGGVIADRVDRVRFLLVTQIMTTIVIAATALLSTFGLIDYWHVLVAGFLLGMGQSPAQPARFTLVMAIAGRDSVTNANALNAVALNSTMVIGPALGGVLVASIGVTGALWLSSSWYVLAVFALLPIRGLEVKDRKSLPQQTILDGLKDGLKVAWSDRSIRAVLFVSFVANVCIWPIYQGFMPVFAEEVFDVGVTGLSWMMASVGIGMLCGSLTIASLGDYPYKGGLFALGTGLYGLSFLLFANSPVLPVGLIFLVIAGTGAAAFGVLQSTLLLLVADESVRGSVLGVQVLMIGVLPVATLVHGFLGSEIGIQATATIAGGALALSMVALLLAMPTFKTIGASEHLESTHHSIPARRAR